MVAPVRRAGSDGYGSIGGVPVEDRAFRLINQRGLAHFYLAVQDKRHKTSMWLVEARCL